MEKRFTLRETKGFTLIELLVVIATVAVLAAALIVAMDPLDKLNAANDSKVQNDISAIATGMEAYATINGSYPTALSVLTASGDLKIIPTRPNTNYSNYTVGATGGTTQYAWGSLRSKRYTVAGSYYWAWCSTSGKAGAVVAATNCP